MSRLLILLRTALFSVLGALFFQLLHIPMAWLLGPLFITMVLRFTTKIYITWSKYLRNLGLVLAGYSIGLAFTIDALSDMLGYLPAMIIMNVFYVVLFLGISQLIVIRTKVDHLAALTSTVPGGMTQVLAYAAEKGSRHLTMITFYQVLRVLCILSFVPLIVSTGQAPTEPLNTGYSLHLILFILITYVVGYAANQLKVPTGYMLGPVLLLIGLQIVGLEIPLLPSSALQIAQLLIGTFIGMLLKKEDLHLSRKIIFYGFVSSILYIGSTLGIALLLIKLYPLDFKTAFLSVVPGGLDQMGLIAASVGADVTIVTAFQLFRVLIVSILIIPSLKLLINRK